MPPKFRNVKIKKPGGGFRMQRAQVLKSGKLKFVKNIKRGGGKAAKKPPARKKAARKSPARKAPAKRRTPVAKKGNPNNKPPKIGAAIQAFKGAQPLLSPVIDAAASASSASDLVNNLRGKANVSYIGNVAATAVNRAVDRKIAQGGALSRGSITAWAPEAFAAFQVSTEVRGGTGRASIAAANRRLALTLNGYDPVSGQMDLSNPDFRTYQGLKIGGGILRRASNMGPLKKVFAPLKKALGEMGGAL